MVHVYVSIMQLQELAVNNSTLNMSRTLKGKRFNGFIKVFLQKL